jgi:hypothetical protein
LHSKRLFLAFFSVKISENSAIFRKGGGGGRPPSHQDFRHWGQLYGNFDHNFKQQTQGLVHMLSRARHYVYSFNRLFNRALSWKIKAGINPIENDQVKFVELLFVYD